MSEIDILFFFGGGGGLIGLVCNSAEIVAKWVEEKRLLEL